MRITVSSTVEQHAHRHYRDIVTMIEEAHLDTWIRDTGIAVFRRLAEAESQVHDIPVDDVHFHEIGAVDTIVDIVGSVAAMAFLGPQRIVCSALNTGSGTVHCDHGWLPVPAPATAALLRGFPAYGSEIPFELLTPTGAALLTTFAHEFGPLPAMSIERIGYGAGSHDIGRPNVLRVFIGNACDSHRSGIRDMDGIDEDQVAVIETQIDDMTPECLASVMDNLIASGAIDVIVAPILMKKGRPGHRLQVFTRPEDLGNIGKMVLKQTTTFGFRWHIDSRIKLFREIRRMDTRFGPIRMKIGWMDGEPVQASPEYEDCKSASERHGVPVRMIMQEAMANFRLTSEIHDVERKATHPD